MTTKSQVVRYVLDLQKKRDRLEDRLRSLDTDTRFVPAHVKQATITEYVDTIMKLRGMQL